MGSIIHRPLRIGYDDHQPAKSRYHYALMRFEDRVELWRFLPVSRHYETLLRVPATAVQESGDKLTVTGQNGTTFADEGTDGLLTWGNLSLTRLNPQEWVHYSATNASKAFLEGAPIPTWYEEKFLQRMREWGTDNFRRRQTV
jgi:hypothetical protein